LKKNEFLKFSATLNEAYKTLKNDYTRASYLLKLNQIDIESENKNYPLPPEVLEKIWDDREELEETHDIDEFLSGKLKQRENLLVHLSSSFDAKAYDEAAVLAIRLRYLETLINGAKSRLSQ